MNAHRMAAAAMLCSVAGVSHAAITVFTGTLGPEVLNATGSGSVTVTYDSVLHSLRVQADFSGLSGNTTVAPIHCCTTSPGTGTAGVALQSPTFSAFPVDVKSGSFDQTLDLTQASGVWSGTFVTNFGGGTLAGAEAALLAGMGLNLPSGNSKAYFNIHSSTFGGGEIRAFLAPVPEPGTWALMLAGLGAIGLIARRRVGRS